MREMYARNFGYMTDSPELAATLTGSADVHGEATVTVKVEAGSTLLQVVEQARTALKLAGSLRTVRDRRAFIAGRGCAGAQAGDRRERGLVIRRR
jgi:hypothetical protein